ncbi:MAG: hypothetical protein ACJATN_001292 [Neolewinella sp.]|jgi:hypothetical protein
MFQGHLQGNGFGTFGGGEPQNMIFAQGFEAMRAVVGAERFGDS